jgi:hypothetical protein
VQAITDWSESLRVVSGVPDYTVATDLDIQVLTDSPVVAEERMPEALQCH